MSKNAATPSSASRIGKNDPETKKDLEEQVDELKKKDRDAGESVEEAMKKDEQAATTGNERAPKIDEKQLAEMAKDLNGNDEKTKAGCRRRSSTR